MPPDAGVAPGSAEWAGNAFLVQFDRDGLRALAGSKLAEDSANDVGLLRDDLTITPDRLAGLALLHAATQAAMGLHGEVLQE